jgi:hypothetical protein
LEDGVGSQHEVGHLHWDEVGRRKNIFIKDNVSGDINMTNGNVKALVPFVRQAIAKEYKLFGT